MDRASDYGSEGWGFDSSWAYFFLRLLTWQKAGRDGIDQNCDGVDASCCVGMVGDANDSGEDVPTIGDITTLIDHLFLSGAPLGCLVECDINQSGSRYPTAEDITIGDVTALIDHLFISGTALNSCL